MIVESLRMLAPACLRRIAEFILVRPQNTMLLQISTRIALVSILLLAIVDPIHAAEAKLGFAVRLEGEGFFLNPLVTRLLVTEVTKGSVAEAAGMRAGDQILQVEGQSVTGRRARELEPLMKLNPGEMRRLRLRHADGTEVDARITKPKT